MDEGCTCLRIDLLTTNNTYGHGQTYNHTETRQSLNVNVTRLRYRKLKTQVTLASYIDPLIINFVLNTDVD